MGHMESDSNQLIQKGGHHHHRDLKDYGAAADHDHHDHHHPQVVADPANKPPQDSHCLTSPEYHPSQSNVYAGTHNAKSLLGATTPKVLLPPHSSLVQPPRFPHPITPATDYDYSAHPLHPQLPASETSGKPLPLTQGKPQTFSLASLELLASYGKGFKNTIREENLVNINSIPTAVTDENDCIHNSTACGTTHKLSLGDIVKVAGERYIQSSTQKVDGFSTSIHPYGSCLLMSELSAAEAGDVELVQILLVAAECVGHRQFDLASALISRCLWISSDEGNPAQRIVYYFAEALQSRVDMETGRTTVERLDQQSSFAKGMQLDFNLAFLACHQALPFIQVGQFAAMQTIADNLKSATKIHLVDLHIRSGIQWTVLMQALAERDELPEMRITAVGTNSNKSHVEETGQRLLSFAQSLNLAFSFNAIIVSDMKELKEEMFGREPEEGVAVYAGIILRTMLGKAESLGNVMKVMRRLKPEVVVVMEVEANHNSPSFVSRFTESLFFYSAFFDSLEDCMERNNEHRKIMEGIYLGEGIINMVGTEGDKRCTRNVRIEVWREYFGRFGMEEVELGDASIRQANLILNKFRRGSSCNLTSNGKGLLIGWKGTPLHSLTAWKFL